MADFSRNEFILTNSSGKSISFVFKTGGNYNRSQNFMSGSKGQVGFENKYQETSIEGTILGDPQLLQTYFEIYMSTFSNGLKCTGIHRAVMDGNQKQVIESGFGNVVISKQPMFTDGDEGQLRDLQISLSVNDYQDPVYKTE